MNGMNGPGRDGDGRVSGSISVGPVLKAEYMIEIASHIELTEAARNRARGQLIARYLLWVAALSLIAFVLIAPSEVVFYLQRIPVKLTHSQHVGSSCGILQGKGSVRKHRRADVEHEWSARQTSAERL
jgi:hypothetical protein